MATKRLDASWMRVSLMLPDKPPGLAEVVAEDTRNLKEAVRVKESGNCGLEINCSSGDGVDSVNLPPLYFPSGKEAHQNPGESSSPNVYREVYTSEKGGIVIDRKMYHPNPPSGKNLLPLGFTTAV